MMKVLFHNIQWDLSEYDENEVAEINLPSRVEMVLESNVDFDDCADLLSDKYGYLVEGYNWNIIAVDTLEELLVLCKPEGVDINQMKDIFNTSGQLTPLGEDCYQNLESALTIIQEDYEAEYTTEELIPVKNSLDFLTGYDVNITPVDKVMLKIDEIIDSEY